MGCECQLNTIRRHFAVREGEQLEKMAAYVFESTPFLSVVLGSDVGLKSSSRFRGAFYFLLFLSFGVFHLYFYHLYLSRGSLIIVCMKICSR